jgi:hypothetical protein
MKNETIWKTKDGIELKLEEIENEHLLNILKYLRKRAIVKKAETDKEYITCTAPEAMHASDLFSKEMDHIFSKSVQSYLDKRYYLFYREAEKRGLLPAEGIIEEMGDNEEKVCTAITLRIIELGKQNPYLYDLDEFDNLNCMQ